MNENFLRVYIKNVTNDEVMTLQIMNILLSIPGSLFCMILISFISVGIILALSIIILGMYDLISCYITNMNKLFNFMINILKK